MTCKVERFTEGEEAGRIKSMTFFCDHPGCDQHPSDLEIAAAGGLTKMGWECPGGKHFCPAHRSKPMLFDQVDKVKENWFKGEVDCDGEPLASVSAMVAAVNAIEPPDDPHTDAWHLGFCRARKMAADTLTTLGGGHIIHRKEET